MVSPKYLLFFALSTCLLASAFGEWVTIVDEDIEQKSSETGKFDDNGVEPGINNNSSVTNGPLTQAAAQAAENHRTLQENVDVSWRKLQASTAATFESWKKYWKNITADNAAKLKKSNEAIAALWKDVKEKGTASYNKWAKLNAENAEKLKKSNEAIAAYWKGVKEKAEATFNSWNNYWTNIAAENTAKLKKSKDDIARYWKNVKEKTESTLKPWNDYWAKVNAQNAEKLKKSNEEIAAYWKGVKEKTEASLKPWNDYWSKINVDNAEKLRKSNEAISAYWKGVKEKTDASWKATQAATNAWLQKTKADAEKWAKSLPTLLPPTSTTKEQDSKTYSS